MIGIIRRWLQARARRRYEEMRRMTDDFGNGPILRYGEDRYGDGEMTSRARTGH